MPFLSAILRSSQILSQTSAHQLAFARQGVHTAGTFMLLVPGSQPKGSRYWADEGHEVMQATSCLMVVVQCLCCISTKQVVCHELLTVAPVMGYLAIRPCTGHC